MKINQINTINNNAGDWLILSDYGTDGVAIWGQYKTPEDAFKHLDSTIPQAILFLPDFKFEIPKNLLAALERSNDNTGLTQ